MKFKIGDIVKLKDESVNYSYERGSLYSINSIDERNRIIAYIVRCNGEFPLTLYIHVYPEALIKICNRDEYVMNTI